MRQRSGSERPLSGQYWLGTIAHESDAFIDPGGVDVSIHALIPSPDDVLEVFSGQIKAEDICWATAEFGGHDTLKSATDEAQAKIKSVESVREPQLAKFQAECLESLRSTASKLPSIYKGSSP